MSDTGLVVIDEHEAVLSTFSIKTEAKHHDMSRLVAISDRVVYTIGQYTADHKVRVFIEAMPLSRRPDGKLYTRTELLGIVKYRLLILGVEVYLISPKTLKSKFAGNGNADKGQMQAAVYNRFQRLIKNDNVADGLALAATGLDYIKRRITLSIERLPMTS